MPWPDGYTRPSPFPVPERIAPPASAVPRRRPTDRRRQRSEIVVQVGLNVQHLRVQHRWSAGQLALRSGVSRAMLSRIEHGLVSPSLATLQSLAQALGVPAARLVASPMRADVTL